MRNTLWFFPLLLLLLALPLLCAAEEPFLEADPGFQTLGREIIPLGSRLWHIADGELRSDEEPAASKSLSPSAFGLTKDWALWRFNLLPGGPQALRVCAAFLSQEGELSVRLAGFAPDQPGPLEALSVLDVTPALGVYYAPEGGFLQVDLAAFGEDLVVTALDEAFSCHLLLFSPASGARTALGELPYAMLTAVLPVEERLLLAGDSLESEGDLSLADLALPAGDLNPLGDIPLGASISPQNFAWYAASNQLFFTLRNAAWRVSLSNEALPEPIAIFSAEPAAFSRGAIADGRYVVLSEAGELLSCALDAALQAERLRIVNATENTSLEEISARYNAEHPDLFLSFTSLNESLSAPERERLLREADAVLLPLSSPEFQPLIAEDRWVDLAQSDALRQALEAMAPPLPQALQPGGVFSALPVESVTPCLTLNVSALSVLTGRAMDQPPRDWTVFLSLLSDLAAQDAFSGHPELALVPGFSTDDLRELLLIYLLRSVLLETSLHPQTDPEALLSGLLQAFEAVAWDQLTPYPDAEDQIPLLGEEIFDSAWQDPAVVFMPLAAVPGGESVIPMQLSVLLLSRDASHPEALLRWAEAAWSASQESLIPESSHTFAPDPVAFWENEDSMEMLQAYLTGEMTSLDLTVWVSGLLNE